MLFLWISTILIIYCQIFGAIETNIQGKETIGIDDNFKEFSYNNVKINNEYVLEEVTDHIDNTVDDPNRTEGPICEISENLNNNKKKIIL